MPDAIASQTSPQGDSRRPESRPFLGLIDAVIVPDPVPFEFDGAIADSQAMAVWTWMQRDLAQDVIARARLSSHSDGGRAALDQMMPDLLTRARSRLAEIATDADLERRTRLQLGGEATADRLPVILNALKCRGLLPKALEFGRAANAMSDDAALGLALQSMPLSDRALTALLLQAATAQVATPSRLVTATVRVAGASTERAIQRAGLDPVVDAILSHAQAQVPVLTQSGVFADVDLICRAIERFHRLMRAVTGYVELTRLSRWSVVIAELTKTVSGLIEPRLREVVPDITRAMRRREGVDRLDEDQMLIALNGCYVLAAVRDARDSLALNAVFDQTWAQLGQALETYMQRNLDALRQNPGDKVVQARINAAIKMAEMRFSPDYAETIRRARDTAERRVG